MSGLRLCPTLLPLISLFLLSLPLCQNRLVHAWGHFSANQHNTLVPLNCSCPQGHFVTGLIAQTLLRRASSLAVLNLLPEENGQLSLVASWADQVRAGNQSWNRPLHCALTPWWSGEYIASRDCFANKTIGLWPGGCVDGAIQNYTHRLNDPNLPFLQRQEALKYIVHFIGDLHQPLHGGFWDDYSGDQTYGYWFGPAGYSNRTGVNITLHSIWDRGIIYKRFIDDFQGNETAWEEYLVSRIPYYESHFDGWRRCPASSSEISPFNACSDSWLTESNQYCKTNVYRYNQNGTFFNYTTGFFIGSNTGYYEMNLPLVEMQLVKAGVRMAHVLNQIFTDEENDLNILLFISVAVGVLVLFGIMAAFIYYYYYYFRKSTNSSSRRGIISTEAEESSSLYYAKL